MPKRRGDGASDTTEIGPKEDALLVRFVERLSNETVVKKLRYVLNPKALTDKLDTLTAGRGKTVPSRYAGVAVPQVLQYLR